MSLSCTVFQISLLIFQNFKMWHYQPMLTQVGSHPVITYLIWPTFVQDLMTVASVIPEIWSVAPKFKTGRVTMTTPIWGTVCHPKANISYGQPVYKIFISSYNHSRDILGGGGGSNNLRWVTWCDHAPFRDGLLPIGCYLLWSSCSPHLKSLCLPTTRIWKATKCRNWGGFRQCLQCFDAVGWASGRASGL